MLRSRSPPHEPVLPTSEGWPAGSDAAHDSWAQQGSGATRGNAADSDRPFVPRTPELSRILRQSLAAEVRPYTFSLQP